MLKRKPIDSLNTEFPDYRQRFADMHAISDNRSYNWIAGFHGVTGGWCHRERPIYRTFLPWHRAYVYFLELHFRDDQVFRANHPDLGIAYWDWTSITSHHTGIPAELGPPPAGAPDSLFKSRIRTLSGAGGSGPQNRDTVRNPDIPANLPTDKDVQGYLKDPDFISFSQKLNNGAHGEVHGWIGGDMGSVPYAGFDPIFFHHHCMIDFIWWQWQQLHGNDTVPKDILDKVLDPFPLTVKDVLDVQKLGYDYR